MRLIADENMPLVPEFFGGFGEVVRLPGRSITAADVQEAGALLLRSVTKVSRTLVEGSRLRFVGTATIGTDHIDLAAMKDLGVTVASAAGCNARAVGEYVATVLASLADEQDWQPASRTLGVIGLGNTGRQVVKLAGLLGFRVLGCDPVVTLPGVEACGLDRLLAEADIISLHVPLHREGPHATWHLLGKRELAALRPGSILINSSRGEVVDNMALEAELARRGAELTAVLDVWEGEPLLMPGLLERVRWGSPHVAGYSQEGKWRGTAAIYEAFCRFLDVPAMLALEEVQPEVFPPLLRVREDMPVPRVLRDVLQLACPLPRDDLALRQSMSAQDRALAFDALRRHYPARHEFTAHRVALSDTHPASPLLRALGFSLA